MAELLGEGLQFVVYDRGDRVEKVLKSRPSVARTMVFGDYTYVWHPIKLLASANQAWKQARRSLAKLAEVDVDPVLVGDPEIENLGRMGKYRYFQDKVEIVQDRLDDISRADFETLVEDYTDLIHACWRCGFMDETFNFTINNGYLEDRLVLVDLGELVFSKAAVEARVRRRKWLNQFSYATDLSSYLRPVYKEKMAEQITVEKLDKHWKTERSETLDGRVR